MKFQWPGGVGRAHAVGPVVDDRDLLARQVRDGVLHFGQLPRHLGGRRRRRRPGPLLDDVVWRHHPGLHFSEQRQHRRPRRVLQALPRNFSARGGCGRERRDAGRAAGRAHAVTAGTRDEDRRDRLSEREAGGKIARRRLARKIRRHLLLGRLRVDLIDHRREEQLQDFDADAGDDRIFRRIRRQIARRYERLDAGIDLRRRRAGCRGTCSTTPPSTHRIARP